MTKKKATKEGASNQNAETNEPRMTKYERLRMQRIRENVSKMQALGMEKKAEELMDRVQSKRGNRVKGKKKKAMRKDDTSGIDQDFDVDHDPDSSSEEKSVEETSKQSMNYVPKKGVENVNKDWIDLPQSIEEYIKGVENFLNFAFQNSTVDIEGEDEAEILCPRTKCVNRSWFTKEVVFDHLISHKFNKRYKVWNFHGEGLTAGSSSKEGAEVDNRNTYDDMDGMINDIFRDVIGDSSFEANEISKGPNESAKKFYTLLEDARKELYPGCKDFSVLSFTVRLYLSKCVNRWSNSSFDDMLKLLGTAFPLAKLPTSFYQAKKMVKNLGLDYKRIDACPNDCMLYWKERKNNTCCYVCKASRWKLSERQKEEGALPDHPAKVLRYFP